MPINPKSLKNLSDKHRFKSKWTSGKTKLIRVPEKIADQVLTVAYEIDQGKFQKSTSSKNYNLLFTQLEAIIEKVNNKEKGYKSNGSGQLLKELRELLNQYNQL
ncbi:hypothetical protein A5482_014815 (plasmid) [Cyanobacterium sp. IPPAS B-1200]|uniref:hypothetical protein n=1 Tax=Cyanobacterium sp. IPPAS B-1200 TaxID=1562720 RepID=UPI0008690A3B|nr:hypothetical protein [Cyanobacterium sp. IPPAS B-1200]OEJ77732.1 hypothetical protein A5482_15140 [Cyanobacterium sp. IPPAS B-1200]